MADQPQVLDVWILDGNTVYQGVPFTVVADWIQQGRLLEEDRLRSAGQEEWFPLESQPLFANYLPKPEPFRPQDTAEALEPVTGDITLKRSRDEEEDDPDMIPLIDISLVLLIFFIMTATAAIAASTIATPEAWFAYASGEAGLMWIGVDKNPNGELVYSLGVGDDAAKPEDRDLASMESLLARLDEHLAQTSDAVSVQIKAEKTVEMGVIRRLTDELGKRRFVGGRAKVVSKYLGVSEKDTQ